MNGGREKALEASAAIAGWLTRDEAGLLFDSAAAAPAEQAVVEIGSFAGKSTVALALGARAGRGARVYAVDPHTGSAETAAVTGFLDTFELFTANLRKHGADANVEVLREFSVAAAARFGRPVAFLFIDGAHGYRSVRADYESWFAKVVDGGLAAFHDSWILPFSGPCLLSARELLFSNRVRRPRLVDTITVFEKTARATPAERLGNAWFVVRRMAAGFAGTNRLGASARLP
jgi:predicted O-methyltransferase YrrM